MHGSEALRQPRGVISAISHVGVSDCRFIHRLSRLARRTSQFDIVIHEQSKFHGKDSTQISPLGADDHFWSAVAIDDVDRDMFRSLARTTRYLRLLQTTTTTHTQLKWISFFYFQRLYQGSSASRDAARVQIGRRALVSFYTYYIGRGTCCGLYNKKNLAREGNNYSRRPRKLHTPTSLLCHRAWGGSFFFTKLKLFYTFKYRLRIGNFLL